MPAGIADTNVLIELYRRDPAAIAWFANQPDLGITSITWLEFLQGARGKQGQTRCLRITAQFSIECLTLADQQWAMQQMLMYRFSYGVSLNDCLIASVCYRLQVPLFTKNVKDFQIMLGTGLVARPY